MYNFLSFLTLLLLQTQRTRILEWISLLAHITGLRKLRESKAWTIPMAAEHIGVDDSTYARWERSVQTPQPRHVKRLAQVYLGIEMHSHMDQESVEDIWRQLCRARCGV